MYERVTWVNLDDLDVSLPKWEKMAANSDHALAELEAVTVATLGYLQYLAKFSPTIAFGIKVDSFVAGTQAAVALTPTDYAILNRSIASVAVGQHTLYFNNLVTKIWKPEGMNYVSAWYRANTTPTGGLFVDFATIMLHRNPM